MRRHRAFRIFSLLLITAAALAAAFFLWQRGAFLARCSPWSRWTAEKTEEAPSGGRIFRILLKNSRISVYSAPEGSPASGAGFEKTWESPSRLKVQDFLFCDIYAARETNTYGVTSEDLAAAVREKGKPTRRVPSFEEAARIAAEETGEGDMILVMGAGDVEKTASILRDSYSR